MRIQLFYQKILFRYLFKRKQYEILYNKDFEKHSVEKTAATPHKRIIT